MILREEVPMGQYGAHPPIITPLNCSRKKIGKLGFGVEQHWQLLFLFRLLIHGVRGDDKGSESLEWEKALDIQNPAQPRYSISI